MAKLPSRIDSPTERDAITPTDFSSLIDGLFRSEFFKIFFHIIQTRDDDAATKFSIVEFLFAFSRVNARTVVNFLFSLFSPTFYRNKKLATMNRSRDIFEGGFREIKRPAAIAGDVRLAHVVARASLSLSLSRSSVDVQHRAASSSE